MINLERSLKALKFKIVPDFIYSTFGSIIMASGWGWYHLRRVPRPLFLVKILLISILIFVLLQIFKFLYRKIIERKKIHVFWHKDFYQKIDYLFFIGSFLFLIFFIEKEIYSIAFCLLFLPVFYYRFQKIISTHPGGAPWLELNKTYFILTYLIFIIEVVLQFAAYKYYILDNNIKFFNIVLFRSLAMTSFWLFGFVVSSQLYLKFKGFLRYLFISIWVILFVFSLLIWGINLGVLYYSGLYFSPIALEHFEGSGGVLNLAFIVYAFLALLLVSIVLFILIRKNLTTIKKFGLRYSSFYNYSIAVFSIVALFVLSSFKNTPEQAVVRSFIKYYVGDNSKIELSIGLQKKLANFGLIYDLNQFYLISKNEVFSPTSTKYLPAIFDSKKPNILIIELESFSGRLTGPYGTKFKNLTPGLDEFAADENSTIFKNFYNASTPTVTGILSQMCSFLPPTGHNEIQNERKFQGHHLLCLPEVLKKNGYAYSSYITAVDKSYANKDGIFKSMGVDEVFGTKELSKYINEKPLSWGYSDHQTFPHTLNFMKQAKEPFLIILSTVDTHPPFNLASDALDYEDGSKPVLNMFHTTDDAFLKFWNGFKQSELYNNTIVIAVADHAIFPGALTTDLFKEEAKNLTYYDENFFGIYIPKSILPKSVDIYSSGIDFTPTLLQILDINVKNSFEGHSIFDDRNLYPNILGMHEFGLYINQKAENSEKRNVSYDVPSEIECSNEEVLENSNKLTLCDYLNFYKWKRLMLEEGRFWKH